VEVRLAVLDLKRDFDSWIQALNFLGEVIGRGVERNAIGAGAKSFVLGEQLRAAAVFVGLRNGENLPSAGRVLPFEAHRDAFRGFALRDVEDVSGDTAHEESHFLSRRWAIWRCWSAAS